MSLPSLEKGPVRRVLIACIGNIFLGDDGFGVEVARQLAQHQPRYPAGVQVIDFGIRGLDLAFELLEDYDALVLVDAVQRGGQPGTLYLVEPDLSGIDEEAGSRTGRIALDAHSMDPFKVLGFAQSLGARTIRTLLVGCEPANIVSEPDATEVQIGLSASVEAAIPGALQMLDTLVAELFPLPFEYPLSTGP